MHMHGRARPDRADRDSNHREMETLGGHTSQDSRLLSRRSLPQIDPATPAFSTTALKTASAVGLLQMFPVQVGTISC